MVSFYIFFEVMSAINLSLIRPIEPVIDDNHSEMSSDGRESTVRELIIEVSGVRGYLDA